MLDFKCWMRCTLVTILSSSWLKQRYWRKTYRIFCDQTSHMRWRISRIDAQSHILKICHLTRTYTNNHSSWRTCIHSNLSFTSSSTRKSKITWSRTSKRKFSSNTTMTSFIEFTYRLVKKSNASRILIFMITNQHQRLTSNSMRILSNQLLIQQWWTFLLFTSSSRRKNNKFNLKFFKTLKSRYISKSNFRISSYKN